MKTPKIGLRWTLGDVSPRGFESLHLSIWGAWRIFGNSAAYVVCVNSIPLNVAQQRTGPLPVRLIWHDATGDLPRFLRDRLDGALAEGMGWKLAPLRCFPDRYELSLDNDCVLWELPPAIRHWLGSDDPQQCLMAQDVRACFGQFAHLCGPEARNAGIRGLPPGFDLEAALRGVLERVEGERGERLVLSSELDEQGLQTAALSCWRKTLAVSLEEVTVCSPFHPHLPHLGRCGAHFVGLNAHHINWNYYDRPADQWMAEHWLKHRAILYERVGLPCPPPPLPQEAACERL